LCADIYKHAFDSARKAEEYKFKAKFDVLLNDLHQTLDTQSPHGLTDSFASTSCKTTGTEWRRGEWIIGIKMMLTIKDDDWGWWMMIQKWMVW